MIFSPLLAKAHMSSSGLISLLLLWLLLEVLVRGELLPQLLYLQVLVLSHLQWLQLQLHLLLG
jgi:hypothetical protein